MSVSEEKTLKAEASADAIMTFTMVEDINDTPDTSESKSVKSTRKSTRTRKARKFYSRQTFSPYSRKRKRRRCSDDDEEESHAPVPPTREEMRAKHVMQLTNVFREYIGEKLDEIDLPIEREKTRVAGLVRSLNNARSLKEKVYVSKTMGYLVSSSDGTLTYNVNPKAVADNLKYVCNCGEKYKDSDRTACKHCGSIIFHNLDNYFSDYLTKPYQPNVHLQLRNVEKMFNKFDIEKPSKPSDEKPKMIEAQPKTVSESDFFSFVMNAEHRTCQNC